MPQTPGSVENYIAQKGTALCAMFHDKQMAGQHERFSALTESVRQIEQAIMIQQQELDRTRRELATVAKRIEKGQAAHQSIVSYLTTQTHVPNIPDLSKMTQEDLFHTLLPFHEKQQFEQLWSLLVVSLQSDPKLMLRIVLAILALEDTSPDTTFFKKEAVEPLKNMLGVISGLVIGSELSETARAKIQQSIIDTLFKPGKLHPNALHYIQNLPITSGLLAILHALPLSPKIVVALSITLPPFDPEIVVAVHETQDVEVPPVASAVPPAAQSEQIVLVADGGSVSADASHASRKRLRTDDAPEHALQVVSASETTSFDVALDALTQTWMRQYKLEIPAEYKVEDATDPERRAIICEVRSNKHKEDFKENLRCFLQVCELYFGVEAARRNSGISESRRASTIIKSLWETFFNICSPTLRREVKEEMWRQLSALIASAYINSAEKDSEIEPLCWAIVFVIHLTMPSAVGNLTRQVDEIILREHKPEIFNWKDNQKAGLEILRNYLLTLSIVQYAPLIHKKLLALAEEIISSASQLPIPSP